MTCKKISPEDVTNEEITKLRSIKFVRIFAKFFGLYYGKNEHWLYKFYFFVGITINILNMIKSFFVYSLTDKFNTDTINNIINSLIYFSGLFNCIFMLVLHCKVNRIQSFMENYDLVFKYVKDPKTLILKMNIMIYATFGLTFFSIFTNFSVQYMPIFMTTNTTLIAFLAPFESAEWALNSLAYKLLMSLFFYFSTVSTNGPLAYYFIHCNMLNFILNNFNSKFQSLIHRVYASNSNESNKEDFEEDFEEVFEWHKKICSLISILNGCYKELIAVNILALVPQIFLTLYILSDPTGHCVPTGDLGAWIFYLIVILYSLAVIVVIAAKINTSVSLFFILINKLYSFCRTCRRLIWRLNKCLTCQFQTIQTNYVLRFF